MLREILMSNIIECIRKQIPGIAVVVYTICIFVHIYISAIRYALLFSDAN